MGDSAIVSCHSTRDSGQERFALVEFHRAWQIRDKSS